MITGPNGGGKTSLAKVISGVAHQTSGQILLNGTDISDMGITERARAGIAYAFQQPVRFKGIQVRDLIQLAVGKQLSDDDLCRILSRVGLCTLDYLDREIDTALSGGEIKRIEIASVFMREANLYVFDEPEAGIDLWSFNHLIDVFKGLKEMELGSIVIISHQERILDIADKVLIIANGQVEAYGKKADILPQLYKDSDIVSGVCHYIA